MCLVILGISSVAALIWFGKCWGSRWFADFVAATPCSTIFGVKAVVISWYGMFVALPLLEAVLVGFALGAAGYSIFRDGQTRPLNQKVFRPTQIRRGAVAHRIGYLQILAFVPFFGIALWGSFQASTSVIQRTHPSSKCAANF